MGRKQLNHVQYKRNIHPDFVSKMDKELNRIKQEAKTETKNTEENGKKWKITGIN